jgi:leucyl-tRNA synthetase
MFPHSELAQKWLPIFNKYQTRKFDFDLNENQEKKYIIDMFPYPSGDGLHVGHVENFVGTDILARYHKAKGAKVFHPIGFDAFGLPAENFAIKKGIHPDIVTKNSIVNFVKQMQSVALDYDWNEQVNSSDKSYYKWTQWMFSYLYKSGLAYRKHAKANWCPICQTVLANEQVINGKCERHPDQDVIQVELPQWFFKTSKYTKELLSEIPNLNWPGKIKSMQKNWIGQSSGTVVRWEIVK